MFERGGLNFIKMDCGYCNLEDLETVFPPVVNLKPFFKGILLMIDAVGFI